MASPKTLNKMTVNIAISVTRATGSMFKPNKNGKMPVILNALNGSLPENSGILDATIAESIGLTAGCQAVIAISPREDYVAADGRRYKNYNYVLVTMLGQGFEQMVAQQVVASMNFGFSGGTPTPTPTPIEPAVVPEAEETPTTRATRRRS